MRSPPLEATARFRHAGGSPGRRVRHIWHETCEGSAAPRRSQPPRSTTVACGQVWPCACLSRHDYEKLKATTLSYHLRRAWGRDSRLPSWPGYSLIPPGPPMRPDAHMRAARDSVRQTPLAAITRASSAGSHIYGALAGRHSALNSAFGPRQRMTADSRRPDRPRHCPLADYRRIISREPRPPMRLPGRRGRPPLPTTY